MVVMGNFNTYSDFGIDSKIKMIQNALFNHLGFEKVNFYGRIQKTLNTDLKTTIPCVYTTKTELKEVYYDDLNAPCGNVFFIEEEDKHSTKNGLVFNAKIKIVFMLNLQELYPDSTTRNDAEVQEYCLKLVRRLKLIDIESLEKGLNNVLKGFDTRNIQKHDIQPYHIFSINGTISYYSSCKNQEYKAPIKTNESYYYCKNGKTHVVMANALFNAFMPSEQTYIRNYTPEEITSFWLDNEKYVNNIGGLNVIICGENSRFEVGTRVITNSNTLLSSIFDGYYLVNQTGASGFGSINGEDIRYRFNPNRSVPFGFNYPVINPETGETNPPRPFSFWSDTEEPAIVKMEASMITEVIALPMTGFAYEG